MSRRQFRIRRHWRVRKAAGVWRVEARNNLLGVWMPTRRVFPTHTDAITYAQRRALAEFVEGKRQSDYALARGGPR